MAVFDRIRLRNFRNFRDVNIEFSKSVNVIIGKNGQGKTNIIESLHLLTCGRSFRPAQIQDLIRKGCLSEGALINSKIVKNSLSDDLKINLFQKKKVFQLNNKNISSSTLKKKYSSVLFSPESLSSIKGGPDQRRALVDELLVTNNLENIQLLSDFKKMLKSRNRLLKEIKKAEGSFVELRDHLMSLNSAYLPKTVELIESRLKALKDIQHDFENAMKIITGDQNVDISVDYLISGKSASLWNSQQIHDEIADRMEELRSAECSLGLSLVGPHKNDIQFLYKGEDSRFFCSQGQQRALILSFKMAQIMYYYTIHKEYPILLLDDVMSELDEVRRSNLISFLNEIDSQIFLTTTEFSGSTDFGDSDMRIFEIDNGCLRGH